MTLRNETLLSATNSILSSIGQAPVTTTTSSNPQTNLVTDILNATILDVLNEEWHFNTEKNVEFCPPLDATNLGGLSLNLWGNPFGQTLALPTGLATAIPAAEIFVDDDILRLDITDDDINRQYDITIRGNRIYDKVNHTFMWTHCIKCDVVYLAFFEADADTIGTITIPEVFKRYMTHRASTRAATKLTNNSNLVKALAQQELLARAACMEYECNQTDASFFGFDHNSHYKSYRPYQTMLRR